MQTTSHLLMIRPVRFGYNPETAVNNAFQQANNDSGTQQKALREFDDFVAQLRAQKVDVTLLDDTPEPHTPDSIFPNNWMSFHADGTVCLYPMFAANRRLERKPHILTLLRTKFEVKRVIDFSHYEKQEIFLEGTGSMILDREHKIVYACLSPRTNEKILADFCEQLGYTACTFTSRDRNGGEIYHTNVMMCVADKYAVICLDSIPNAGERKKVTDTLGKTSKEIVAISMEQMEHFAGNMLQIQNVKGTRFLVMSDTAYRSLLSEQLKALEKYNPIIHPALHTIEVNGGGSARCMMAEIFLPEHKQWL